MFGLKLVTTLSLDQEVMGSTGVVPCHRLCLWFSWIVFQVHKYYLVQCPDPQDWNSALCRWCGSVYLIRPLPWACTEDLKVWGHGSLTENGGLVGLGMSSWARGKEKVRLTDSSNPGIVLVLKRTVVVNSWPGRKSFHQVRTFSDVLISFGLCAKYRLEATKVCFLCRVAGLTPWRWLKAKTSGGCRSSRRCSVVLRGNSCVGLVAVGFGICLEVTWACSTGRTTLGRSRAH